MFFQTSFLSCFVPHSHYLTLTTPHSLLTDSWNWQHRFIYYKTSEKWTCSSYYSHYKPVNRTKKISRRLENYQSCAITQKKMKKNNPKNNRPVALLPIFSKILEKAIFLKTVKYLEENDLLHPSHHGFRSEHNTTTALLQMYDTWIDAFKDDEITAVVLIDMSAAFDVVDHVIPIE